MQASSLLERALNDTVATVYLTALEAMRVMVQEYLPTVPGREFLIRAALQPALRAVVLRLGKTGAMTFMRSLSFSSSPSPSRVSPHLVSLSPLCCTITLLNLPSSFLPTFLLHAFCFVNHLVAAWLPLSTFPLLLVPFLIYSCCSSLTR